MSAPTLLAQPEHHGLVESMPFPDYLAVEALSASSARKLLPPSCPALFRQEQLEPQRTREMDFGHIAHAAILEGLDVASLAAEVPGDWRTKGPKAEKEAVEANGLIPLHPKEWAAARGMVAGVRSNRMARALFDHDRGRPEVSLFWETRGTPRKGRPDFLPNAGPGRFIIPDLKTTSTSADAGEFGRTVVTYGYAQQLAAYVEGIRALGIDDDPLPLLVVQEVRPPYLVNVLEIPEDALRIGHELNLWATRVYAECVETGVWRGYSDEVELVQMPQWWLTKFEEFTK